MAAFEWSQPFPIYQKGFKLCQEITHSDDGLHDLQFADTRMITYRAPVRAKNEKSNFLISLMVGHKKDVFTWREHLLLEQVSHRHRA